VPRRPSSTAVRDPVVAGTFYPGTASALGSTVDGLLDGAALSAAESLPGQPALRGVIVPHAGYSYSGPVAARAFALVAAQPPPRSVVILGASHFWPLRGLAVPSHAAWRTPLGIVSIDATRRATAQRAGVLRDDRPHTSEHSIEVQLPFLQRICPGVPVLPVAVGDGAPDVLAVTLARILDEDTLLVVSTDLSHYQPADVARRLDARTAAAIEALDHTEIGPDDACGVHALRASLAWARSAGSMVRRLDLRNSADTAGSPEWVVGYGAFSIEAGGGS